MLTALDSELFSNDCEVVHVPSHDLRIYLIHKNASSSLRMAAREQGWKVYKAPDFAKLDSIDIFLRDPYSRLISGLNTYLQHLVRDHPGLDPGTCEFFATRYLFLNKHYLPQWHWLANACRFLPTDCQLRFHALKDLLCVTNYRTRALVNPIDSRDGERLYHKCHGIDAWLLLDQVLLGLIGQSHTWSELLQIYQEHPSRPLGLLTETLSVVNRVLR